MNVPGCLTGLYDGKCPADACLVAPAAFFLHGRQKKVRVTPGARIFFDAAQDLRIRK
jgi:hypothetical protein